MSIDLNVSLDARALRQFRRLLTASRPEAAKALTFTAEKAQAAWRGENGRVFHLRGPGLNRGVAKRAATAGNLVAQVGTRDKFFGRHVKGIGGDKHGGSGRLLVPTYGSIDQAKTHTAFRRILARMGGTKRGVFTMQRGGETFLMRRLGKGRTPITTIAVLRASVRVAPRFDAKGLVERTVQTEFGPVYARLVRRLAARG